MIRRLIQSALLLSLCIGLVGFAGCERIGPATQSSTQPQSLPTIKLDIGTRPFTLEVAANDETRAMGLMHRDSMPADHGMIFLFTEEQPLSFWMKNTRIPLEILYLDSQGRIVSIRNMKPYDLIGVESGKPAKFAIELNPGTSAAAGAKVGDQIKIPPDVASAGR